jgi:hypothetical protein
LSPNKQENGFGIVESSYFSDSRTWRHIQFYQNDSETPISLEIRAIHSAHKRPLISSGAGKVELDFLPRI